LLSQGAVGFTVSAHLRRRVGLTSCEVGPTPNAKVRITAALPQKINHRLVQFWDRYTSLKHQHQGYKFTCEEEEEEKFNMKIDFIL
jgi:hypothetical protein